MIRSLRMVSLLVLALGLAIPAMALNVVNTSAPAINCVFSTTCSVGVMDNLSSPVYGGSFPGDGESSYFFGLVSNYPPVVKTANVHMDNGYAAVNVYAPQVP